MQEWDLVGLLPREEAAVLFVWPNSVSFVWSLIVSLFFSGCPLAVRWLVVPIVVYSLDSKFWRWAESHIGNEVSEVLPTLANSYSTSTIICVSYKPWVAAAIQHGLPDEVFFRNIVFPYKCAVLDLRLR